MITNDHDDQDSGATRRRGGLRDLVFFAGSDGTPQAPGHVGIVIGAGTMIEAYAPGYPVRVATYGQPSSPPGDQAVVGVTRPWATAGANLAN